MPGHGLAVDDREREIAGRRRLVHNLLRRQRAKRGKVGCTELRREVDALLLRRHHAVSLFAQRWRGHHIGALGDGLVEQPACVRCRHQIHDTQRSRGLPGDRHIAGVTAESADIALHPGERRNLVEQPVISRHPVCRFGAERGMRKIAERAKPVVDRNDNHAPLGKRAAVIERVAAGAGGQRTAVDPEKYRRIACIFRCPDIERQAILAHRRQVPGVDAGAARFRLHACGAEFGGIADVLPGGKRLRRCPAQLSGRGRRIGDALENMHAPARFSFDLACRRLDHRAGRGDRRRWQKRGCDKSKRQQTADHPKVHFPLSVQKR